MKPLCNDQERAIVDALRRQPTSQSAQELAARLGIDPRTLRARIAHLRADHEIPIASTPAGSYWFPRSRADWERTKAQMLSRVIEVQRAVDGGDRGADRLFGEEGTGQMGLGI